MSSFIEPTSDPAPIGVWEGEYKFAADQIIVVGRAVAFAVPAVMLVSLLIFFLDGIAAKGSFVDPGIFSVILGLLISEVMTMLSIATELDPKWAIVKSLPSATVTVGGSIATAVAVERIYQDRVQVRAGFITGYLIFHWIAGFVWRFCFFGKVLDKLLQRCTPRRVEDESGVADEEKTTVPTEAPKSSLKLFLEGFVTTTVTVVLVVVGYMGISICVQVSRLYTGNLLVTFTLFAIFSLLQNLFFLTSAQANELNGEEKHKLVKSTEQFFMPAFAMFLIPIKLFRLMQAIRNPAYTFWPLLFLSQIFDRALPRLLFGRQAMAKAKKLKEAAEAAISLDGDYNEPDLLLSENEQSLPRPSTPPQLLGDLPPPTNSMEFLSDRWVPSYPKRIPVEHRVSMKGQLPNEIAYIHEEDVSIQGDQIQRVASIPRGSDGEHRVSIQYQSSQRTTSFLEEEDYIDGLPTRSNTLLRSNTTNSDSPKNFDSGVPSAMNRHLSVLGPHRQRSTLRRQRTFTTSHGSLQTNVIHTATVRVVKKIMEVGDIQFPVSHDIIRRDHCTAEYASMLISLALVCVSPGDFLALPGHDMGVVRQEFYGVNGVGDDSGREYLLGTNDLVLMLGGRPLAAVVLTTVVSLLYAGVIERVVVMWEKSQGFPMYTVRSKFQPRVYFTIVTAITIMLVYIFAGARGLFAFGPLQVKYDIN